MANEVTTSVVSELIQTAIAQTYVGFEGLNDLRQTVTLFPIPAGQGSFTVPNLATVAGVEVAEGADGTNVAMNTTAVILAPSSAKAYTSIILGDLASYAANESLMALHGKRAAKSIQMKINQDICGLFTSATRDTGTGATTDLTAAMVKAAVMKLRQSDSVGPYWAVFSPATFADFETDLLTNYNTVIGDNQKTEIFKGNAAGIEIFGVQPMIVKSGRDESGGIINAVFAPDAIGYGYFSDRPLVAKEIEGDTYKKIVVYAPYDVKIINDDLIVKITSDGE